MLYFHIRRQIFHKRQCCIISPFSTSCRLSRHKRQYIAGRFGLLVDSRQRTRCFLYPKNPRKAGRALGALLWRDIKRADYIKLLTCRRWSRPQENYRADWELRQIGLCRCGVIQHNLGGMRSALCGRQDPWGNCTAYPEPGWASM